VVGVTACSLQYSIKRSRTIARDHHFCDGVARREAEEEYNAGEMVAVKLFHSSTFIPHMARRLDEAGADALVQFNRFYQPDLIWKTAMSLPICP